MKHKFIRYFSLTVLLLLALYSLLFTFRTSGFVFNGINTDGIVKHRYYDQGVVENRTYVSTSYKNSSATLSLPLIYKMSVDKNKETDISVVYYDNSFYVGTKSTIAVLFIALLTMFLTSVSLIYFTINNKKQGTVKKLASILLLVSVIIVIIL